MQSSFGRFNETTRLIESARLTPTEHSLWRAFLNESVDREYAAQYIWERIHDHTARPVEQILTDLKLEWKQVVSKCQSEEEHALVFEYTLTTQSVSRRDSVSHESQTRVETRDGSQCFMVDQNTSNPHVSVHFDHAWAVI